MPGILTLIGSGETSSSMVKIHQSLIEDSNGSPRAVFLDTPAAFEMGLTTIQERFQRYFSQHVGTSLHVISEAEAGQTPAALANNLRIVQKGTYFVAGPGSASYAIRRWKSSLLFHAVLERWRQGAALTVASAAAIAFSQHALPVYEIYKVGQDLHWNPGLNLLGAYGYNLCIMPHWDNKEGGSHDTRACFMGMQRFERLRAMLPEECVVLGIDEHTACSIDLNARSAFVRGNGKVTILRGEQEITVIAGEGFPLELLVASQTTQHQSSMEIDIQEAESTANPSLAQAVEFIGEGKISQGLRIAAAHCQEDSAAILHLAAKAIETRQPKDEELAPFIDLLLTVRNAMRQAEQWELADQLRAQLSALGVEIQDTEDGARWSYPRD